MTKIIKCHAAPTVATLAAVLTALIVATLAAVLTAPPEAGAQYIGGRTCTQPEIEILPGVEVTIAASEVAGSGILFSSGSGGPLSSISEYIRATKTRAGASARHDREYSDDGGLTWKPAGDSSPYYDGELGVEGLDEYGPPIVRGECDGPLAGKFRLRDSGLGEYSDDGGLTWTRGTTSLGLDYLIGEHSVDNYDGPAAGMHRYRYTRPEHSSDPQDRLVMFSYECPGRWNLRHYDTLANPPSCDFDDVRGSVHRENIGLIAGWGITLGCGDNRFCPSRTVSRAQMAAFLYRAAEHLYGAPALVGEVRLSDVADDAWYRAEARWAVGNGVIRAPGGNFDPGGPVTRADMAEMLVGAFTHLTAPDRAEGLFTDTAGLTDGAVRAVEGIRAAGVTTGCATDPPRYCPDKTVTRAQMASFLARAVQSAP